MLNSLFGAVTSNNDDAIGATWCPCNRGMPFVSGDLLGNDGYGPKPEEQ